MTHAVPLRHLVIAVAVTGALTGGAGVAVASHQFDDVPTGQFFHEAISDIVDAGCATGFNDGTFGPAQSATRGQFAYWTSNCATRVAHDTGRFTIEEGTSEKVRIQVEPGRTNDAGFVMYTVDWSARPATGELAGARAQSEGDVQLLGAPPPCPCLMRTYFNHELNTILAGPFDAWEDVWPTDTGGGLDDHMQLQGSRTYVRPTESSSGGTEYLTTVWEYLSVNDSDFADPLEVHYDVTALFLPFGFDGSQALTP